MRSGPVPRNILRVICANEILIGIMIIFRPRQTSGEHVARVCALLQRERMLRVAMGVFISSLYAFFQENVNGVRNHIYEYILQERMLRVAIGIYISLSPNVLQHDHLIQFSQLVGLSHIY